MTYGIEIWSWKEKTKLEKIMLDYVRWIFKRGFCIFRYMITRELGLEKLKVDWRIRANRNEIRVKQKRES